MKTYREIAEMLEKHIDKQMEKPIEALSKDIAYSMEIWNSSVIRADKEEKFTLKEKEQLYIKMLKYAETLLEPSLNSANEYGVYRGLYVFHIYVTMRENLEEIQNAQKG